MTTTTRCKIAQLSGLTSASQVGSSRKNVSRKGHHLPQIQDPANQIGQKINKRTVISSNGSRSSSAVGLRQKQNDEQLLASRLSKISLQKGSNSRNLSSSGPVNVEGVVESIRNGITKHIVVMVGAGISTPSGIPDFRTPGTGLYDNLKQYRIPYPEAVFDIEYFRWNPRPFFTLAKELYPNGKYRPNYVHYFLKLLHDNGLLHRLYTQNIDGLERSAGIPACKLVEAHGTFATSSCIKCGERQPSEDVRVAIFGDKFPRCYSCRGMVKPDIVFFGEDLPKRFFLYKKDFHEADLLLVLGTSLEVEPFAGIVDAVQFNVPRLLFNRELVGPFRSKLRRRSDFAMTGDITEQLEKFVELLNLTSDLKQLIEESKSVASPISDQKSRQDEVSGNSDEKDESLQKTEKSENHKTDNQPSAAKNNAASNSDMKQLSHSDNLTGNKLPTAFHAQKELFRNGKNRLVSSSSSDLETTSSDEDSVK